MEKTEHLHNHIPFSFIKINYSEFASIHDIYLEVMINLILRIFLKKK